MSVVVSGNEARVALYADRVAQGLECFTGKPLPPSVVAELDDAKAAFFRGWRKGGKMRAVPKAAEPETCV